MPDLVNNLMFEDTSIAFKSKSDSDLKRALNLFSMFNIPWAVRLGNMLGLLAIYLRLPVGFLIRNNIFKLFCGGETLEECKPMIKQLAEYGIDTVLDHGVEGKKSDLDFEKTTTEAIRIIEFAGSNKHIPVVSIKLSAMAPFQVLKKAHAGRLNAEEKTAYDVFLTRLLRISKVAEENNTSLYIDAEESWIQNTIDEVVTMLMVQFNKEKAVVYNTFQIYRHDRLELIKTSLMAAKKGGYRLGVKLVRGAYLKKERDRAARKGYPSPIQPNKESTDRDFNKALEFCTTNLNDISLCVATHNEKSCQHLVNLIYDKGIDPTDERIYISQLYGMGDHISYNLADSGFRVSKYLPYGRLNEVIPYLIRRAQENSSIAGQMGRELGLIKKEIDRRKN